MRNFIKNTKKDLEKLGVGKKKKTAEVIPPTEPGQDFGTMAEKEQEQPVEQPPSPDHPQAGQVIKYVTEMVFEVIDEEGEKIPCKTQFEANILSRLIELRLFLKGK